MNEDGSKGKQHSNTRAARILEDRNRAFRILYDTVMEVVGASEEDTYDILCHNVCRICNARYATLSEYDHTTSTLTFKASSWEDESKKTDDEETEPPRTYVTPTMLRRYSKQQVRTCTKHTDCAMNKLDGVALQEEAAAENAVPFCLSSIHDGILMAVVRVYLPAGERLKFKDVVDTFMNLTGMILQRVHTTRALKRSLRELARHNNAMTGREKRIVELKTQVNDLLKELGREQAFGEVKQAPMAFDRLRDAGRLDQSDDQNDEDKAAFDVASTLNGMKALQGLLESFCESVGIAAAIIDLQGNVLVGAKWQRICTDFHRHNPETCKRCIESDTVLANQMCEGEGFSVYACKNGLTDAASPIIVDGKHVANFFVGQFLLDAPDVEFFRKQAAQFGFPQDDYLRALADVPIVDHQKLQSILAFLREFAVLVGSMEVGQSSLSRANTDLRNNREALLSLMEDLIGAREKAVQYARQAEDANRSKSEFLANMSHEIRTPMTAILGFADVMLEHDEIENAPHERIEAAQTIKKNGEYLISIINDILDLSKVEAGKMSVEKINCNPCTLIAEVATLVKVKADSKRLAFNVEYAGAVPETIRTDPTRLRQILINLIGNAIKFTEIGGVRLITRFIEDKDNQVMQFDVLDTGIGMTEEQVAKLFQPFTQADASTTRKFGGTGLGLTISKRFAVMLGGDIAVIDSGEGVGTRFRVTVAAESPNGVKMIQDPMSATTVAKDDTNAAASAGQLDLNGCRILVAEDNATNGLLITRMLTKAQGQVTAVENGKIAAESALAARDEGEPFDVILMDMQMPVMDGYEAATLLRQKGYTGPIIALTAHAMASDRQKCIDAGCNDYAAKPINRKKLIETIQTHRQKACNPQENRTPLQIT